MKWLLVSVGVLAVGCSAATQEEEGSSSAAVCVQKGIVTKPTGTTIGPAGSSRTFPETGLEVRGSFLSFMDLTGGTKATGLPISNVFSSVSRDGSNNPTQCFERQVLEYRSGNSCESTVLGRQLGRDRYERKYGAAGAPGQNPRRLTNPGDRPSCFDETPHCIEPIMYDWWKATGGLAVNGFPISDYFEEESPEEPGKKYWVQYFERTVGEYHETPDHRWTVEGQLLGKYAPECPVVQSGTKVRLVSSRTFSKMQNRSFPAAWWTTREVGGKEVISAFTSEGKLVVELSRVEHDDRRGFEVYPSKRPDTRKWSADDIANILQAYSNDNEDVDVWQCLGATAKVLVSGIATVLECTEAVERGDATFCSNEIEVGIDDIAELGEACFPDRDGTVRSAGDGLCRSLDNGVFGHVYASCSPYDKQDCVCKLQ